MVLTLPLFAPHRPSMPIVLLPTQLPVHPGVPTDRNPISQSLTSGGIPELRAHAISARVPRERYYNAVLGKGTDKARTRRRRTSTVSQARRSTPQSEICVQVSSVPRLLGALGTAPWRRVENEKWAATFPSGRGCSVSSSRSSSSAAAALTAITAPIRSENMRERIILWLQRRRRGNMAMPAFPGLGELDVREKAVAGHVLSGGTDACPIPTQAV
jgi:hypothetical protein